MWYYKDHIGNKCTYVCFNVLSLVALHAYYICIALLSCMHVVLLNKFDRLRERTPVESINKTMNTLFNDSLHEIVTTMHISWATLRMADINDCIVNVTEAM